ncbi:hypothetical protein PHYBLDRAFT_62215 [Phycomyces blakesleeanus NRRL 1555(-)]|uniref:Reverse transcriptase zinc-binding domain-containing protein n=1 Tax=Phycomyces blakesleeanus (strain ATCC 8743b / DSM 1359 / FGSC 10004 / NBRC 33097 / NRRL 1555) TaxID=763407 RepID=A0A167Q3K8_PHYB8|nr:hypothetical protein PHYBLDRAFT_62215 [Phycomyces blakesleeanus NRRL 1555(-)]OAD79016.1 hypothetical protein PHYBLDRAFT_62215 [Phycomyces blakesleeanus NRRL 1555(-)]|eukprot:XP_018297056.1 hypothetical protein PHYBLDRAFT_62215 [Phycomyces blakesleeanus NRRL 1555(-)]
MQVLIQACRPVLGVDPILFLPASRMERGRLIRWRMGWLPGKTKECPCGSDHTSRRHLLDCPLVPVALFEQLPQPDQDQIHRIDFAITSLPLSSQEPRPAYWIPLLTILWHIDIICNPDGDYSHETEHDFKKLNITSFSITIQTINTNATAQYTEFNAAKGGYEFAIFSDYIK